MRGDLTPVAQTSPKQPVARLHSAPSVAGLDGAGLLGAGDGEASQ